MIDLNGKYRAKRNTLFARCFANVNKKYSLFFSLIQSVYGLATFIYKNVFFFSGTTFCSLRFYQNLLGYVKTLYPYLLLPHMMYCLMLLGCNYILLSCYTLTLSFT